MIILSRHPEIRKRQTHFHTITLSHFIYTINSYLIIEIRSDIILKAKEDKADDPDDDDDADYDEGGDEDENQQTIVFLSGCKMFQNVSPTILSYFYLVLKGLGDQMYCMCNFARFHLLSN